LPDFLCYSYQRLSLIVPRAGAQAVGIAVERRLAAELGLRIGDTFRLDAAVMRFVGVRRRTIFGALLLEAVLVASVGSVLGTALAFAAGAATNSYYQRFFDIGTGARTELPGSSSSAISYFARRSVSARSLVSSDLRLAFTIPGTCTTQ
jgi:predicted lysophospholipase L1 biosynthesis ABC-type transport system permease subunit